MAWRSHCPSYGISPLTSHCLPAVGLAEGAVREPDCFLLTNHLVFVGGGSSIVPSARNVIFCASVNPFTLVISRRLVARARLFVGHRSDLAPTDVDEHFVRLMPIGRPRAG